LPWCFNDGVKFLIENASFYASRDFFIFIFYSDKNHKRTAMSNNKKKGLQLIKPGREGEDQNFSSLKLKVSQT
jgi:hypothetical protein